MPPSTQNQLDLLYANMLPSLRKLVPKDKVTVSRAAGQAVLEQLASNARETRRGRIDKVPTVPISHERTSECEVSHMLAYDACDPELSPIVPTEPEGKYLMSYGKLKELNSIPGGGSKLVLAVFAFAHYTIQRQFVLL